MCEPNERAFTGRTIEEEVELQRERERLDVHVSACSAEDRAERRAGQRLDDRDESPVEFTAGTAGVWDFESDPDWR